MKKLLLSTLFITSILSSKAQLDNGLIAFYPFNGDATDESDNSNDATTNTAVLTSDRFSNANSAFSFSGTEYIQIPAAMGNTLPITISLWLNCNNLTNPSVIQRMIAFSNSSLGKQTLSMNFNLNGNQSFDFRSEASPSGSFVLTSSATYNANTWYHLVMTINPVANVSSPTGYDMEVKMYVNTTEEAFGVFQFQPVMADEAFIGKYNASNSQAFAGKIDDIGIWNRVLTTQEISDLYNGTLPTLSSGVSENIFDKPTIYPNPTNQLLNVNFSEVTSFEVVNILGEKMSSFFGDQNYQLDLSTFPSGVYFIKDENGSIVKFIKE
ncbi:MAG: T9SS type A sorting domain-containing protein [Flavobacteriales bacterium]|nr:T9SS type A sorting domain-containing protein [Flavobacteriales bacterium]